ncbi:MAG TPA: thioredoxin family protein [Chryseosolibacter sp.]
MKILVMLAFVVLSYGAAIAQNSSDSTVWLTNVNEAHALSKSTGKPIFAFFTGSDWCVWCRKLQAEVFAKPAFKEWASSEVVLLELDFPARKVLPAELVQQNEGLKAFFKISGFPTIWLFCINEDKEKEKHYLISPYGTLGYPRDPVKGHEEVKFLEDAKTILASRTCQIN